MGYAKNGLETHFQRYSRYRLQAIIRQGQSSRSNQEDIVSWRAKKIFFYMCLNHFSIMCGMSSKTFQVSNLSMVLSFAIFWKLHIIGFTYGNEFTPRCGDRVKNWITFNEPYTYVTGGYVRGEMAPGRCSSWQNLNCTAGDSGVEPYLVAHHQLLSHAAAVMKYKEKYQESQKSKIGITLVAQWVIPFSKEIIQREAAARALDFSLGWKGLSC
ncbi:beta-glucosidase 12-like isoform X2 [Primulina eburnea]|uniref:beta-glucosidase 12-like isoform X2 n=1 Tax=Primulina eburnea TaxID=1245227 RepID=UPI003C6C91FE